MRLHKDCQGALTLPRGLGIVLPMTTTQLHTSKIRSAHYGEATAETRTVSRAKNAGNGERVAIIQWITDADKANGGHPAGTIIARHLKGGWRNLTQFGDDYFAPTIDDAIAYATACLTK
jgi:hypothetical protein